MPPTGEQYSYTIYQYTWYNREFYGELVMPYMKGLPSVIKTTWVIIFFYNWLFSQFKKNTLTNYTINEQYVCKNTSASLELVIIWTYWTARTLTFTHVHVCRLSAIFSSGLNLGQPSVRAHAGLLICNHYVWSSRHHTIWSLLPMITRLLVASFHHFSYPGFIPSVP